jgi:hypothetical protein
MTPSQAEPATAAVIVRQGEKLAYIPAAEVGRIVQRPPVSPIPAADFGMALIGGHVVPALEVGVDRAHAIWCQRGDDEVALLGLGVVSIGYYSMEKGLLRFGEQWVPAFDVDAHLRLLRAQASKNLSAWGRHESH